MELQLDDSTRRQLRQLQRTEKDKRRYVRITVILMLDLGLTVEEISVAFGLDGSTIYRYLESYSGSTSLQEYLERRHVEYSGKLTGDQQQALAHQMREHLYRTSREIVQWVRESFAVEYTATGIVPLLKRLGFVYKKTRQVPPTVDTEAQEAFVKQFEALIEEAEASVEADCEAMAVYFSDAVHPQHNTRSCYGWIASAEEFAVSSTTGRERVNLNGALNALEPSDVVIREDQTINAESVIGLYEQLQAGHPSGRIIVICDNARYHHSRVVRAWLENSRIEQVFLPSYSPNLNLIERLWKFLHKKVIDAEYYATKQKFREAIFRFFENIRQYRSELQTLLTLNFHIA